MKMPTTGSLCISASVTYISFGSTVAAQAIMVRLDVQDVAVARHWD